MCFSVQTPKAPDPAPAPVRADASNKAQQDTRRVTAERQGIYGNIFSSILGDAGYGSSAKKLVNLGGTSDPTATASA
tara:strand:- start:490 stop:720 length:231 start_codon:yes stop_codon:yes gene_type:complete